MRKLSTILFLTISLLLVSCKNSNQEISYEAAAKAFQKLDFKKSETILKKLLQRKSLNKKVRFKTLKILGRRDWKFHHNLPSAINRLMEADSLGINRSSIWLDISIVQRRAGNYKQAIEATQKALQYASNQKEKRKAHLEFSSTTYKMVINNIQNNISLDKDLMKETEKKLLVMVSEDIGSPAPSQLLMGISLLLNSGDNFLKGWKSYFHIADIDAPYPYFSGAAKELKKAIIDLQGTPPTLEKQEQLIKALGASRLYRLAYYYTKVYGKKESYSPQTRDILEFAEYLIDAKRVTDEYYRQIALNNEDTDKYKKWLKNRREKLWNGVSEVTNKEFNPTNYGMEMRRIFGAFEFTGRTGNYGGYVLGLGLIVNQEVKRVKQFSYEADFTYTQLDMMESIGYSTWFWGRGIGGTATANEIIRVRSAYLDGPFEAWDLVTNPEKVKENREVREKLLKSPVDADIYKTSSDLSEKLWFDGVYSILQKFKDKGLKDKNLKLEFLQEFTRCRVEASIFAHEGRHAIDQKYFGKDFKNWNNTQREFRAKLSQISFATKPKIELAQIIGTISKNSKSGHHKANIMIAKTGINWIKNNHHKIDGYSDKRSAFSQLHLLTSDQLRTCFRESDPLYKAQKKQ